MKLGEFTDVVRLLLLVEFLVLKVIHGLLMQAGQVGAVLFADGDPDIVLLGELCHVALCKPSNGLVCCCPEAHCHLLPFLPSFKDGLKCVLGEWDLCWPFDDVLPVL